MTSGELFDADDVIDVAVRAEDVRDRDLVVGCAPLELVGEAVAVDEEAVAARAFRDEVRVGQPLRMLRALDDHANSITLRMPSCASISSNPRLTSSSVMRCETNDATSISPASARSTYCGTSSRPFTPPNDEPATRLPVMRKRGTMSSVSPLPATPATVQRPQPMRAASTA